MKHETANDLLEIALKHNDIDAFETACRARPWNASKRFNPIDMVAQRLTRDKLSKSVKISDSRKTHAPFLSLLAQHGYECSGSSLSGLSKSDHPSFIHYAKEALKYSDDHSHHLAILHRIVERKDPSQKSIEDLIKIGFDVNGKNKQGNTPMHCIVAALAKSKQLDRHIGQLNAMQTLYRQGARFSEKNKEGLSASDAIAHLLPSLTSYAVFADTLSAIQSQILRDNTTPVATTALPMARRL